MSSFYFFYQRHGKESAWELELAEKRQQVIESIKPVFATALDLSSIPSDNDWSKVRYRGDYYLDFDDEEDLPNVIEQFKNFLGKLTAELNFDITQARFYLTGKKGLHVEIPCECFMPKVPVTGTPWLPYIYRAVSESLVVDTMDMAVFTGKRGRQWRTPNVRRENGNYKVQITIEEAMSLDEDLYGQLVKEPRELFPASPPVLNSHFAMLFERAKDKITTQMRGKKKRVEKANAFLDPWIKAKKTPPTIDMIMRGENIAEGAGFQAIAMQLAIYAVSVSMALPEFLDRCKGLCETHQGDSRRYRGPDRRREELSRMWDYFQSDTLYDFDTGPLVRLVKEGTPTTDLGVMDTEDREDATQTKSGIVEADVEDGDTIKAEVVVDVDMHKGLRQGRLHECRWHLAQSRRQLRVPVPRNTAPCRVVLRRQSQAASSSRLRVRRRA
jgi:hypothetical protein